MHNVTADKYDNLGLIKNRISYLLGARLRNKDRIKQAIHKQEEIKNRHGKNDKWDAVSQIRKLRDNR